MSDKQKGRKTLVDLLLASGQPISQELTELLAAYGPPAEMPNYRGDSMEYMQAAAVFEGLAETSEAAARRDALERYFARSRNADHPDV